MNERLFVICAGAWLALAALVGVAAASSVMTPTGVGVAFLAWMGGIVTNMLTGLLWRARQERARYRREERQVREQRGEPRRGG